MSNFVFVLDRDKQPLEPCSPTIAKKLLNGGKAAVLRQYPFTIVLKKAVKLDEVEQCQLKLDPGSVTTGIALLQDNKLLWAAELTHRGQVIKNKIESRRSLRRGRRARKTRYRQPRFLNRTRTKDWLPPSLEHRVLTTMTWVKKLIKLCPISSIAMELVKFDSHKLQNPEISGKEYQQGTLYQYEVREYLLEKWGRICAYCGAKDTPLEVEHIKPKSRGGTNRVSNLAIACVPCNQAKSNLELKEFLAERPSVLKRVLAQAKAPLKDAAAVNSTRWKLLNNLQETGLPVTTGTGAQTKFNRTQQGLPKRHYLDAAMVSSNPQLEILTNQPLLIKCSGHGNRQMCGTNKYGFPIRHRTNQKVHKGFQTGDIVLAIVIKGKKIGTYIGRVLVRASGNFDISTDTGRVAGISYKYCFHKHKKDGYQYSY
jgi:5-methylcytosine-specific restriction endonuclease McrA